MGFPIEKLRPMQTLAPGRPRHVQPRYFIDTTAPGRHPGMPPGDAMGWFPWEMELEGTAKYHWNARWRSAKFRSDFRITDLCICTRFYKLLKLVGHIRHQIPRYPSIPDICKPIDHHRPQSPSCREELYQAFPEIEGDQVARRHS